MLLLLLLLQLLLLLLLLLLLSPISWLMHFPPAPTRCANAFGTFTANQAYIMSKN